MAHKKSLTKAEWDALPEAKRKFFEDEKLYIPDGDNWKLDAEGIEDVSGLRSALQKERDAKALAEKARKDAEARLEGVDLGEYQALKAEKDKRETDDLAKAGKSEEIIQKLKDQHAAEKKNWEAKLADKDRELDSVYIDDRLHKVFAEAGVLPDRLGDAVSLVRSRAKRTDKGEMILFDEDGTTQLDISPEVFAKEVFKEKKPWLYQASGTGGSGANGGGTGASGNGKKTMLRSEWAKLTPQASSDYFKAGGTLVD